jgi:hypothetical protein
LGLKKAKREKAEITINNGTSQGIRAYAEILTFNGSKTFPDISNEFQVLEIGVDSRAVEETF